MHSYISTSLAALVLTIITIPTATAQSCTCYFGTDHAFGNNDATNYTAPVPIVDGVPRYGGGYCGYGPTSGYGGNGIDDRAYGHRVNEKDASFGLTSAEIPNEGHLVRR